MKRVCFYTAADGSRHKTKQDAKRWDVYCLLRDCIENADLDWRDGIGPDAATPDRVADLIARSFVVKPI